MDVNPVAWNLSKIGNKDNHERVHTGDKIKIDLSYKNGVGYYTSN